MTAVAAALRPLWWLATGVVASTAAAAWAGEAGAPGFAVALAVLGVAAVVLAGRAHRRSAGPVAAAALWLAAGLALGGWRGLESRRAELDLAARMAAEPEAALRVEAIVREGWSATRWGFRTRVAVLAARRDEVAQAHQY